jgi:hypothetical protein
MTENNIIVLKYKHICGPLFLGLLKHRNVFWFAMPYSLERTRHFGGKYRLHIRGRTAICFCCFLPSLLFDPEDADDILVRNAGLSLNYTNLETKRQYSSW